MNQNLGDHPRYETYSLSYSCKSDDMTNMAGEHTQVLTCTQYNGTYAYNRTNVTACDRCFNPPPLDYANTTFTSRPVWVIGDQANATCDPSHQVAHNVTQQLVNCTILGWQMLPCQRVCLEAPNVTNATTNWVDNMWTVNKNVTANCLGNLYFPKLKSQTRSVNCTWNGWDNTPICMQERAASVASRNGSRLLIMEDFNHGKIDWQNRDPHGGPDTHEELSCWT
ncbi:uncharacterized protein [Procambarus clarkii]|uniref:uncharacterized protein n=1 Tax=Procambarus clarkii TaxID=6728 RepID=UPI0037449FFB